jgi:hypothetical protein
VTALGLMLYPEGGRGNMMEASLAETMVSSSLAALLPAHALHTAHDSHAAHAALHCTVYAGHTAGRLPLYIHTVHCTAYIHTVTRV